MPAFQECLLPVIKIKALNKGIVFYFSHNYDNQLLHYSVVSSWPEILQRHGGQLPPPLLNFKHRGRQCEFSCGSLFEHRLLGKP